MVSSATPGFGILFKRGDGGVGAGTKASRTIGASNQQLKVQAKVAGVAGNSKTFAIVVSGNNTPYSQVITPTSVLINSATDGSAAATTTVLQAIANLYTDATFDANFDATVGAGNGSGVLVAGAAAVLSGGAAGAEIFATIAEIVSVGGPNMQAQMIDVTNMDSPNNTREFIPNLIDAGEITFGMNFLPTNVTQQGVYTDFKNRVLRNYQLVWTDTAASVLSIRAAVSGYSMTNNMEAALQANVTLKISTLPTWF